MNELFPHKIELDNTDITVLFEAKKWCEQNTPDPVDCEPHEWRYTHYSSQNDTITFAFKTAEDLAFFKLAHL